MDVPDSPSPDTGIVWSTTWWAGRRPRCHSQFTSHEEYVQFPDGQWISVEKILDIIRSGFSDDASDHDPPTFDDDGVPLPKLRFDDLGAAKGDPLLATAAKLAEVLPERWKIAVFNLSGAADEVRSFAIVVDQGKPSPVPIYLFVDAAAEGRTLRAATRRDDGGGAWCNALLRIYEDGTVAAHYDYSSPPFGAYLGERELELLRRDQELYPRDRASLPSWHPSKA
ncbi:hypothetical protein [Phytoactinopolyspora limicola]|uniref:hypothetical protein n=1 Tax=Phytoactinopolyspora limicola TaxID=2715536 RepID=UPI001408B10C|nr:hypothetical protein [Phytoactinopolyspora limicola]